MGLIGLGSLFLLARIMNIDIGELAWPFFIIVPGLLFFAGAASGKSASALVIPGSIITMIGLILFFQNVTDRFETWAYAWALIPLASGVGQFIHGSMTGSDSLQEAGRKTANIGLALFIGFGAMFEVFIFHDFLDSFFARYILPLALIGAGAYLFFLRGKSVQFDFSDHEEALEDDLDEVETVEAEQVKKPYQV